jgi:hypothetical protein
LGTLVEKFFFLNFFNLTKISNCKKKFGITKLKKKNPAHFVYMYGEFFNLRSPVVLWKERTFGLIWTTGFKHMVNWCLSINFMKLMSSKCELTHLFFTLYKWIKLVTLNW